MSQPAERPTEDRQAPDDADALRQEIESTREDVGETVDAIADRLEESGRRAVAPAAGLAVAVVGGLLVSMLVRRRRKRPSERARARIRARRRRRRPARLRLAYPALRRLL